MTQTIDKITRLIKARYPIVAVVSHEEGRVCEALRGIADAQDKALYEWTISAGMRQITPIEGANDALADPVAVLQWIVAQDGGDPAIFILKDLHPFTENPVVLRNLRDCARALISRRQTIVLLSPAFTVPPDAEKDVAVVDFPLPTADEIARQVEVFIENLPAGVDCELNGGREAVIRALQGLTAIEADAVLAQAVVALRHLDTDAIPFILEQKAEIIRKSGALEYYPEQASYADIGGLDLLKAWARESEGAFTAEAAEYGIEAPRGVLIVGVPGCGKSLTAKAIAGGTRPLLRLDVGALFGSLVGQSEAQTRNALKVAEAVAPCVVWVDEIEKALGGVGSELDGGTSVRVLGTILTWMQETKAPVFLCATANDAGSLRPELVRRFSEVFFVDLPNEQERIDILSIHLSKRGRNPSGFALGAVAQATAEFTGSELEKVVQGALRRAFADLPAPACAGGQAGGKREVTTDDLLAVTAEMVPLATTMATGIAAMREWAARARPASSKQRTGRKASGRALEL